MLTKIECLFLSPDGTPMANAGVEIKLNKSAYNNNEGIIIPRDIFLYADSNGELTLNLWPSDEKYHLYVEDAISDAVAYYEFYVPESNSVLRLQDLTISR